MPGSLFWRNVLIMKNSLDVKETSMVCISDIDIHPFFTVRDSKLLNCRTDYVSWVMPEDQFYCQSLFLPKFHVIQVISLKFWANFSSYFLLALDIFQYHFWIDSFSCLYFLSESISQFLCLCSVFYWFLNNKWYSLPFQLLYHIWNNSWSCQTAGSFICNLFPPNKVALISYEWLHPFTWIFIVSSQS